jgi:hypothetical protein
MPSSLLTDWAEFFNLEPWGTDMDNWRAGQICSIVANVNRDPKKRPDPYKPQDFMPKKKTKRMTAKQIKTVIKGVFGGTTSRPITKT